MHLLLSTCLDCRHSASYTAVAIVNQFQWMELRVSVYVADTDAAQTIKAFPTAAGRAGQGHPFR
jgi:hypothetical protein